MMRTCMHVNYKKNKFTVRFKIFWDDSVYLRTVIH